MYPHNNRVLTSILIAALLLGTAMPVCAHATENRSAVEVTADSDTGLTQSKVTKINNLLSPWRSVDAPGVSVSIALDDKRVYSTGVGMAEIEQGQRIKPETVFMVASVSKQFTAFATLLLVDEGQIGLDQSIRTYLPELGSYADEITIRHLLDHMGGLRERNTLPIMAGRRNDDVDTHADSLAIVFRQQGVNFSPRAKVEYSNTGYALLAEIVARVSGQSFAEFTKAQIFDPLGMTQTLFPSNRNLLIPKRAAAYDLQADGVSRVIDNDEMIGSTGLYTTAPDLLRWADNFRTMTVGNEAVMKMMKVRNKADNGDPSTLAKGQELRPYKGFDTWSHGGTDGGYKSFLLRIPSAGMAVSLLSNQSDFDTAKIAFALADIVLEDHPDFRPEPAAGWMPASADQMQAYAGNYAMFPGNILTVAHIDGGLAMGNFSSSPDNFSSLPQIGPREFLLNPARNISIRFAEARDGVSAKFDYVIGLHGSIPALRVSLSPFVSGDVELEDYVGVYHSEELETDYALSVEDGALVATLGRHCCISPFTLSAYQPDEFMGMGGPLEHVLFTRDKRGRVTGFKASAKLAEGIRFVRRDD